MLKLVLLLTFTSTIAMKIPATRQEDTKRLCNSIHDCHACLMIPDCFASFEPTAYYCLQYPVNMSSVPNGTVIVEKASCCPTSLHFSATRCGFSTLETEEPAFPFLLVGCSGAGAIVIITAIVVVVICCRKRKTCMITPPLNMPQSSDDIQMTSASLTRASHLAASSSQTGNRSKQQIYASCGPSTTRPTSLHQQCSNVHSNPTENVPKETLHPSKDIPITLETQERSRSTKMNKNVARNPLKTTARSSGQKPLNLSQLLDQEMQLAAEADWIKRRSTLANHPLDQSVTK